MHASRKARSGSLRSATFTHDRVIPNVICLAPAAGWRQKKGMRFGHGGGPLTLPIARTRLAMSARKYSPNLLWRRQYDAVDAMGLARGSLRSMLKPLPARNVRIHRTSRWHSIKLSRVLLSNKRNNPRAEPVAFISRHRFAGTGAANNYVSATSTPIKGHVSAMATVRHASDDANTRGDAGAVCSPTKGNAFRPW